MDHDKMVVKHNEMVDKANKVIQEKSSEVLKSEYRLHYHMMAPAGWMNDPNGLIQYKGEYHMFYQHYPFGPHWGPMHWGHAKSKDLVHWEHLPVALAPSEPYDYGDVKGHGCFSGSAVVDGEKLVLIYTGHVDKRHPIEVQCIAESTDGLTFKKYQHNPVIAAGDIPKEASKDFRDPKVWIYDGKWYMVVGTSKNGKGKIVLYNSEDLKHWEYKGVAAESDGSQGDMWECPDLFPISDQHVLIVSPMNMSGKKFSNPIYMIGYMNYKHGLFTRGASGILDYGPDFYAPQTFIDDNGRRIMFGWMDNWTSKIWPSEAHGWAGAMTVPRELVLEGNVLKQKPVDELKALRGDHVKLEPFIFSKEYDLDGIDGEKGEKIGLVDCNSELVVEVDLDKTEASVFGLHLRVSEDGKERTEVLVDLLQQEIRVDRNNAGVGPKGVSKAPLTVMENRNMVKLHLLMDTTSLELFINDGETVITNRIYTNHKSAEFRLVSEGGKVSVNRFDWWKLKCVFV
ncbi:glycoside hydrolase family 32 protein [Evansella tamaricis]|uniref:Sucrose-6-phosphate hydrolase n=1 Tax=Evansella tamaricis TaxID=2069301 RepID=A0ABS6JAI6_9BACI|nr:glycoside hydrolase family 32 protein [Evansella tamaricis]MBU9710523.1 glycoside hydrolase family 32 protein [Evansella tamaricis]